MPVVQVGPAIDTVAGGTLVATAEVDQTANIIGSATLTSGGFVTIWQTTGGFTATYVTIFDANGNQVGSPLSVAPYGIRPVVTALSTGGFTVGWVLDPTYNSASIHAQTYSATGTPLGDAFTVASSLSPAERVSTYQLAGTANGNLIASWTVGDTVSNGEIAAKVITATGTDVTAVAHLYNGDYLTLSDLDVTSDGRALLTYTDRTGSGVPGSGTTTIHLGIYDPATNVIAADTIAVTPTSGFRAITADTVALQSGNIVVGFVEYASVNNANQYNFRGELFSADGTFIREVFSHQLTSGAIGNGSDMVALPSGGFAIAYEAGAANDFDIVAQTFDDNGDATGAPFLVSNPAERTPYGPVLTAFGTDDLAVAWNYNLTLSTVDASVKVFYSTIPGTTGDDVIAGTTGDDIIIGLAGNDTIHGLAGNDAIDGGDGNDTIYGDGGNDQLLGGVGDDILYGGDGSDHLEGGTGNDTYYVSNANATIVERAGEGIDTVYSPASITLSANVENLVLTGIDNVSGTGNELDNQITGNDGNNILIGGAGNDTLSGGDGNDYLFNGVAYRGPAVAGTVGFALAPLNGLALYTNVDGGNDVINGGAGYDTAYLVFNRASGVTLDASNPDAVATISSGGQDIGSITGVEAIAFYGTESADVVTGGIGKDILNGRGGDDILRGGEGDDTLNGGSGTNLLDGGAGIDTANYTSATAGVTVDLNLQGTAQNTGVSVDTLISIENVVGSAYTDTLIGDAGNNRLSDVNGGDDKLYGNDGDDTLSVSRYQGPSSTVLMDGGSGNDTLVYSTASDRAPDTITMHGGIGDDRIYSYGGGNVSVDAGSGNDTVTLDARNGHYDVRLGDGADTLVLTTDEPQLSGGQIVLQDFTADDRIVFSGASLDSFAYTINGNTLIYGGGSVTLQGPLDGHLVAAAAAGGGVEFHLVPGIEVRGLDDVKSDFNGDGRADILWRNAGGDVIEWLGQAGGGFAYNAAATYHLDPQYQLIGTGDYNGDGRSDALWRDTSNGNVFEWNGQANGTFANNAAAVYALNTDWQMAVNGDFNADGRTDVIWRNAVTGATIEWLGQGNGAFAYNAAATYQMPTNWTLLSAQDINGDHRSDLVWRDDQGTVLEWLGQANGSFAFNANATYALPTNWTLAANGDFNADGRDDILWHDQMTGSVITWMGQADGSFANNPNAYFTLPSEWRVNGVADYNGDGRDDLVWRNSDTGGIMEWLGTAGGFAFNPNAVYTLDSGWKPQPADIF